MPRVVISGYYGFHNSGDEAMLYAMLLALRDAVPNLEPTVLSKDPAYTAREFGVRSVSRENPGQVLRALRNSDLLISGGGGLLQDVTGPKSVIYYLGIVAMARLLRKPVLFYAQGFGPVRTALGKKLVRLVANRVHTITVRDPDSKEELLALGVTRPRLLVTADPVLGLEPSAVDRDRGRQILTSLGLKKGPVAGISVRPWKALESYKEVLAKAADDLVERGWQVLLVPMHSPGDVKTCREVARRMRRKAFLLEDGIQYKDLLAVTANLDLAIGMRLHFLIFSAISGVPVIGIPYDPKVNRFLQALDLPAGLSVENLEYEPLALRIKEILAGYEQAGSALKDRVAHLRVEALKNARLVAELFRKV